MLLDVAGVRGVDWMGPGEGVFPEDLAAAEVRRGVCVGQGLGVRWTLMEWLDLFRAVSKAWLTCSRGKRCVMSERACSAQPVRVSRARW